MKRLYAAIISFLALMSATNVAWAAEEASSGGNSIVLAAIFLSAGLAIGLGTLGPGIAQGQAVKGACEGMARNPGMSGKLFNSMIIGLAFMESLTIYALVVAMILLFIVADKFI